MDDEKKIVVSSKAPRKRHCGGVYRCGCFPCWHRKDGSCRRSSSSLSSSPEQLLKDSQYRYFESFAPGMRFQPTDEEAVLYYLTKRNRNEVLFPCPIQEVNMYMSTPEDLLKTYKQHMIRGKELYVFTSRTGKYPKGYRPERYLSDSSRYPGYWKIVGAPVKVCNPAGVQVGVKRTVNFFKGSKESNEKTNFTMHEYILEAETDKSTESAQNGNGRKKQKQEPVTLALCKIWEKRKGAEDEDEDIDDTSTLLGHDNTESDSSGHGMVAYQGSSDSSGHGMVAYQGSVMGAYQGSSPISIDAASHGNAVMGAYQGSSSTIIDAASPGNALMGAYQGSSPIAIDPASHGNALMGAYQGSSPIAIDPASHGNAFMRAYQGSFSSVNTGYMSADNGTLSYTSGFSQDYCADDTSDQLINELLDFENMYDDKMFGVGEQDGNPGSLGANMAGNNISSTNMVMPSEAARASLVDPTKTIDGQNAGVQGQSGIPGEVQGDGLQPKSMPSGTSSYGSGFGGHHQVPAGLGHLGGPAGLSSMGSQVSAMWTFAHSFTGLGGNHVQNGEPRVPWNGNSSNISRSMPDQMATGTKANSSTDVIDDYLSGKKQNGELPLNQESQSKSSIMSNKLPGPSFYNFDEQKERIAANQWKQQDVERKAANAQKQTKGQPKNFKM